MSLLASIGEYTILLVVSFIGAVGGIAVLRFLLDWLRGIGPDKG